MDPYQNQDMPEMDPMMGPGMDPESMMQDLAAAGAQPQVDPSTLGGRDLQESVNLSPAEAAVMAAEDELAQAALAMQQNGPPPPLMEEQEVVRMVNALFHSAKDARTTISTEWDRNWKAYNNIYNWAGKKKWQAKVAVPKVAKAIDFIAGVIKNALTYNKGRFYACIPASNHDDTALTIARLWEKILAFNLETQNFVAKFEQSTKGGLLTSGPCYKMTPSPEPVFPGAQNIDIVDMRQVFKDPTGRDKFVIHLYALDYSDLQRLDAQLGFDQDIMEELRQQPTGSPPDSDVQRWKEEAAMLLGLKDEEVRNTVYITEYWGPFWQDHVEIMPIGYALVANGKRCLKMSEPDPLGNTRSPYYMADIIERPYSPYGKSYIGDATPLHEAYTRATNILLDGIAFEALSAFEVNINQLEPDSISTLKDGLAPGSVIRARGDQPVLRPVATGRLSSSTLAVLQTLDSEFQGATLVTDIVRGTPAAMQARESTLGEFRLKEAAASRSLNAVASGIEIRSLEPLLNGLLDAIVPYFDIGDTTVQEILGDDMELALELTMDPQQSAMLEQAAMAGQITPQDIETFRQAAIVRLGEMMKQMAPRIQVKGISAVLQKGEDIEKLQALIAGLMQTPAAQMIDWQAVSKRLVELSDEDPEDFFYSTSEMDWMQQQAMMMAQGMAQQLAIGPGGQNAQETTNVPASQNSNGGQ